MSEYKIKECKLLGKKQKKKVDVAINQVANKLATELVNSKQPKPKRRGLRLNYRKKRISDCREMRNEYVNLFENGKFKKAKDLLWHLNKNCQQTGVNLDSLTQREKRKMDAQVKKAQKTRDLCKSYKEKFEQAETKSEKRKWFKRHSKKNCDQTGWTISPYQIRKYKKAEIGSNLKNEDACLANTANVYQNIDEGKNYQADEYLRKAHGTCERKVFRDFIKDLYAERNYPGNFKNFLKQTVNRDLFKRLISKAEWKAIMSNKNRTLYRPRNYKKEYLCSNIESFDGEDLINASKLLSREESNEVIRKGLLIKNKCPRRMYLVKRKKIK